MTDRLGVYNDALRCLGERPLTSLTEEGPTRRALDAAWTGSVQYLLEEGLWKFAKRAVQLMPDEDAATLFGYSQVYSLPSDYVRLDAISSTDTFYEPLTNYEMEAGRYVYANINPMFIRYISNGTSYGNDIGAWPQTFAKALAAHLAFETAMTITQGRSERNDMMALYKERMYDARSKDAIDTPARSLPRGSFRKARSGAYAWSNDRR